MATETEFHCQTMGDNPELVSAEDINARYTRMMEWPTSIPDAIDNDPRCGCAEDGEGAKCWWDDTQVLEIL